MKYTRYCLLITVLLAAMHSLGRSQPRKVQIHVRIENTKKEDSLTFFHYNNMIGQSTSRYLPFVKKVVHPDKAGVFSFEITTGGNPSYLSMGWDLSPRWGAVLLAFNTYLVEPGDSIVIDVKKNFTTPSTSRFNDPYFSDLYHYQDCLFTFSGRGYAKFACRYQADAAASVDKGSGLLINREGDYIPDNRTENCLKLSLAKLEQCRKQVTPISYQIMRADFIGKYTGDKTRALSNAWINYGKAGHDELTGSKLKSILHREILQVSAATVPGMTMSRYYISMIVNNTLLWQRMEGEEDSTYSYLKAHYAGELRDKILICLLLQRIQFLKNAEALLLDALSVVKTGYCKEQLAELFDSHVAGQRAYNFRLPDTAGKMVQLEDYFGKVVFIDFWFTGCGACKKFYKQVLSTVENKFKDDSSVVFISISIDIDRNAWIKSVRTDDYSSTGIVNLYTGGHGSDHEVISHYKVLGYPRPLLIGRNGNIVSASNSELREYETLVSAIAKAIK